ncbi:amidohydrolase family protein [Longimicrobium sp.]|jgi:imidazolonepropionase-like amidohydrolase|uniref:amidohydrolase family protein n=1 Tax=Longimicrobium sp. TaxID=2029185 RepID=UPI002F930165
MSLLRSAAALVIALSASGCADAVPADASLAITHVVVIDGTGAPARADQTVVVVGGRIALVGPSASTAVPRGARRIDGGGRWLIPGLWDMHVHAFGNEFPDFAAPLLLAHGVTGARDMGFYVDSARFWTGEVRAGRLMGPRMVIGGRLDGPANRTPWVARAATADEARHAVDSLVAAGADFIKVYSRLPRDAYFAAADQARRRAVKIAGHVPHEVSTREAAGQQDGMEHEDDLMRACSSEDTALRREFAEAPPDAPPALQLATIRDHARRMRATYDPGRCAAVMRTLARTGTSLTPTLAVYQPYMARGDTSVMHPSAHRYVPRPMLVQWRARLQRAGPGDTSTVAAFFSLERTGEMHRAGVRLLAGTDAPLPYLIPGLSLHDELALLVRAGLTPMEALRTATYNPAAYLGALDSLGTIRPGRLADLVLLDADPLSDIRNTRRIHTVIANGRVVDRPALLRRAEAYARRSGHGSRR